MGSNLLQAFWDLSSYEEEERIKAAKEILQLLGEQYEVSVRSLVACGESPAMPCQVDGVCAELEYALKRLVKGLASNRKRARHGFYTALTQVMQYCVHWSSN